MSQICREHASVACRARQPGATRNTVWRSIKPLMGSMAADETRFDGVSTLGGDEHLWHHVFTEPIPMAAVGRRS